MSKVIVVGTIGRSEAITAALMLVLESTKHEVVFGGKPESIKITKIPAFDERRFCCDIQRKSKGEKRRDRSERRRKWGI